MVMDTKAAIKQRWEIFHDQLDERQQRLFLGLEAQTLGRGGITAVAQATGVNRKTVARGLQELKNREPRFHVRGVRRNGAGRPSLEIADSGLKSDLIRLVDPSTRGDPSSPLCWTTKSLRHLAAELGRRDHPISHTSVGKLLKAEGYSLQGNAKVLEGRQHPDRDAQFHYISEQVSAALTAGEPAISVDTKKKEPVGLFKNKGQEWLPAGEPLEVLTHDFLSDGLGRASPYGIYDLGSNAGFVRVGTDHDTPAFAVAAIERWWALAGKARYPRATRLTITADCGGSNSYRSRCWKKELSRLAAETGLSIVVCHFPPGTSKWNKIERQLFSQITLNWRGRPLVSYEVIVNLIAGTRTKSGLTVLAELDPNLYPLGVKVSKTVIAALPIEPADFHGEWNYTIRSRANVQVIS